MEFDGKELVKPEDLITIGPVSDYRSMDGKIHEMERDVAKDWSKENVRFSILGIEHQSKPEANMPARILAYDGASYRSQLLESKDQKVSPVVTIVLYFGTDRHWDKPKSLIKSMEDFPKALSDFVCDYKINVFEIAWLSDETIAKFKSDFKVVAEFFSSIRKGTDIVLSDKTKITHVDEIIKLLSAATGDPGYEETLAWTKQTGKEIHTMCDLYQRVKNEGLAEGRAEGRAEGGVNMLIDLVNKKLLAVKDAAEQLNISEEAFIKLMQQ